MYVTEKRNLYLLKLNLEVEIKCIDLCLKDKKEIGLKILKMEHKCKHKKKQHKNMINVMKHCTHAIKLGIGSSN